MDVLSDEELRKIRKERRELAEKKWTVDISEQEEERFEELKKKVRAHYKAIDLPPTGHTYPPYWEKCHQCGTPHKSQEESTQHWRTGCEVRKLDAEIAELAMGWEFDETDDLCNRGWFEPDGRYPMMDEGYGSSNSFNPSRNMEHTYWVMKKLEKKDWEFEIRNWVDKKCVTVFAPEMGHSWSVELDNVCLPEAICRAILKALNKS